MKNRVIKFRAWYTVRNQYVGHGEIVFCNYGDTGIKVVPNSEEYIGDSTHHYYKEDRFTIEQSTGLTDKNGKEIFEGDILRVVTKALPAGVDDSGYAFIGSVVYDYGAYVIKFNRKFGFRNELSHWALNCSEVIGNIHESPDLLK